MSTDRKTVSFKATAEQRKQIRRYQQRRGYEDRSPALEELVNTGLREQRSPILWRVKDRVIDWVSILGISAIIVFLAGSVTSVIAFRDATLLSLTFAIVAVALLAGYETARLLSGTNAVGVWVRDIVRGGRA